MTLRMMKARVKVGSTAIAKLPPRETDPFYFSPLWKATRLAVLTRDGFRCATPGCERRASIADHIISRRNGGADDMGNLRSLCSVCDNRVKQDASGQRRSGGLLCS